MLDTPAHNHCDWATRLVILVKERRLQVVVRLVLAGRGRGQRGRVGRSRGCQVWRGRGQGPTGMIQARQGHRVVKVVFVVRERNIWKRRSRFMRFIYSWLML